MVEIEKAAFAATWRDESTGEIVGYTLGDTMCQSPRRPWALTIANEGDQLVAPCGECPGCLEFLRRRLADRLTQKYSSVFAASRAGIPGASTRGVNAGATLSVIPYHPSQRRADLLNRKYGKATSAQAASTSSAATRAASAGVTSSTALWLIRIWAPADLHYYFSRKLHRRRGLELESGTYRLGMNSFAVIARSAAFAPRVLKRLGLRYHVEPIRLSRGRRAWRRLTSGILIARAVYGEQTKRWYARGLPPAERLRWDVIKKAMQKPWRRRTGARVRTGSRVILVPPAIWSMDGDRVAEFRKASLTAVNPEEVIANQRRLAELVAGSTATLRLTAPAEPALTREQVRAFYVSMAQRKIARASATPVPALTPSTLLGGGLLSSVHISPTETAADGAPELLDWLHSGAPPPTMGREQEYEDWLDECWSDGRTRRAIIEARMLEERAKRVDQGKEKFERETQSWLERMKSKIRGG